MARQGATRQKIVNREARRAKIKCRCGNRRRKNRLRFENVRRERALVKNTDGGANEIYQKNTSGGAETDSAPGRSPKNLTRICAARKTSAREIKRREAEPKTA